MSDTAGPITGWLRSRFPVDPEKLGTSLNEPVPNHLKKWWFCVGGTPAYLFVVQAITGILLTFYYVPEPSQAYDSVAHITNDVPFGWWVRSLHKWSSNFMIVAVILHAMRVYFTGAYRKPREFTWATGAILLILTMVFGFTGYSLVYEQLSYWGATVAANLTETVPIMGEPLARFAQSPVPYLRVDGGIVAMDWADLVDGSLIGGIESDETGTLLPSGDKAWTNADVDGTAAGPLIDCVSWTDAAAPLGRAGRAAATSSFWTEDPVLEVCATPHHLYCFEQ